MLTEVLFTLSSIKLDIMWWSAQGWEDGEFYRRERMPLTLDRWQLQAGDELTLHFPAPLDDIQLHQDPHSPHLGGYVWSCGIILSYMSMHIAKHHKAVMVLELGAGITGLPSIAWHRLGARRVFVTDIEALIPALQRNLESNRMSKKKKKKNGGGGEMIPLALEWQPDMTMEQLREVVPEQWQDDLQKLDTIVMCDCIYSEASATALVATLRVVCEGITATSGPRIDCVSEIRNADAQERFVREAEAYFDVRLVPCAEWHALVPDACRLDYVNYYQLRYRRRE
jgi:predicted nicotinamide N-methyase